MSNDSTFEVRITQRMFNKGTETVVRKEAYTDWGKADAAWCAYRDLVGIKESAILAADLIEHRKTVKHRTVQREEQEIPLLDDAVVQS